MLVRPLPKKIFFLKQGKKTRRKKNTNNKKVTGGVLSMTSRTQTARHEMTALKAVFSGLSNVDY